MLGGLLDLLQPGLDVLFNHGDEPLPMDGPIGSLNPKQILVLESHMIGDSVLLAPLLASLRVRFPSASLDVLGNGWIKDVLQPLGIVDHFEVQRIPWSVYDHSLKNLYSLLQKALELRSRRYDLAIDPRGDARNAFLLWVIGAKRRLGFGCTGGVKFLTDIAESPRHDAHLLAAKYSVLAPLGIIGQPGAPRLVCSNQAEQSIQPFLSEISKFGNRTLLGFHPGASQVQRRLGVPQKVGILQGLASLGGNPILMGASSDRVELEMIASLSGLQSLSIFTGTLPQFMALLNHLSVMVGMDSGPAHLAAAMGTPTVVMVEAHKAGITTPMGPQVTEVIAPSSEGGILDLDVTSILMAVAAVFPTSRSR
jgi:ADP-heptose:LPS heptosyltransferase